MDSDKLLESILGAVSDGVSKSSMLASSLAVKLANDSNFAQKIIENIDEEVLAKQVAREMIRKSESNNAMIVTFKTIEKMVASMIFEQMQKDSMEIR